MAKVITHAIQDVYTRLKSTHVTIHSHHQFNSEIEEEVLGDLQRFFLLFNLEYSSAICIILIERGKTEDAAALIKDHIFIQLTFEFSSFTILRSPLNQKNLGLSALVNHIIVRIVCPVVRTTKYQHIKIQNCFKMFCDQMLHQGPQASR